MPPSLDQQAHDGFLAQEFAGFEPVEAFDQDVALAVFAYQNWRALTLVDHAFGNLLDGLGVKGGAALDRHVDVGGFELLLFEHGHGVVPSQYGASLALRKAET